MLQRRLRWIPAFAALCCWALAGGVSGCSDVPALRAPASRLDSIRPDTSGSASLAHFRMTTAQRSAAGDSTLMSADRLLGALTDSIPGYTLDISLADTLETSLATLTEAKRLFLNAQEASVQLLAGDYGRDPSFMEINLLRYNLAQGVEVGGVTDVKCNASDLLSEGVPNSFCWSSFNKVARTAHIYISVDYRYFIMIEATRQDKPLDPKQVASWLNWKSLYL